jgi:hypothetical protein
MCVDLSRLEIGHSVSCVLRVRRENCRRARLVKGSADFRCSNGSLLRNPYRRSERRKNSVVETIFLVNAWADTRPLFVITTHLPHLPLGLQQKLFPSEIKVCFSGFFDSSSIFLSNVRKFECRVIAFFIQI